MIQLKNTKTLLEECILRKIVIGNFKNIPVLDKFYLEFISTYEGIDIIPDIQVFGYEKVLRENQYLKKEYPFLGEDKWVIGSSGQGDSWFMDKASLNILFYDHDKGEFNEKSIFIDMGINFESFFQMGFLFRDIEDLIDNRSINMKKLEEEMKKELIKLNPLLSEMYPFDYFD